jgi:8-amino-7-oxononanoate synthase
MSAPMHDYSQAWRAALSRLEGEHRRRALRDVTRLPDGRIKFADGREMLDFASNDYLGLSFHPELIKKSCDFCATQGTGAGASRLVAGNLAPFSDIEAKLAAGKGAEAALLFVSGVQANLTILPALLDAKTLGAEPLVYADRLNHASLIQGCIGAGVRQNRFRHNDLTHLEELLRRDAEQKRPRFIITESVFSMDGDCTDIAALSALAETYGAFLYVDEAHATGVLGANGFGLVKGRENTLAMGTFSKGLGGFGAYAACSGVLRDYLINRCGGVIYATALPPAVLGAMLAAVDLLPSLDAERAYLQALAADFRARLHQAGLDTGASSTQIVPVILGDEAKTLAVAAGLEEDGFYVAAIRPPTVPAGTSRLRVSLSAAHRSENMAALADAIIRRAR